MDFRITSPCKNCPFRSDIPGYLNPGRVDELEKELKHKSFTCHKTDRGKKKNPAHCAGALILQEKIGRISDMAQIAERLGLYDPSKLDMDAPVYNSFAEMRAACESS